MHMSPGVSLRPLARPCLPVYVYLVLESVLIELNRYLEAIPSLCTAPTFVMAMENRLPTLSYLPYFLLPQRLDQIRSLYIQWILHPGPNGLGACPAWHACWDFLARLTGLKDLRISFECDDPWRSGFDCSNFELRLRDYVTRVSVSKTYVVVLLFYGKGAYHARWGVGD